MCSSQQPTNGADSAPERMTLLDRIAACENGYDILNLDPRSASEGHPCPCFSVQEDGVGLDGSCWRGNESCVIRFKNVPEHARRHVKHLLDELNWYGEWATAPWRAE